MEKTRNANKEAQLCKWKNGVIYNEHAHQNTKQAGFLITKVLLPSSSHNKKMDSRCSRKNIWHTKAVVAFRPSAYSQKTFPTFKNKNDHTLPTKKNIMPETLFSLLIAAQKYHVKHLERGREFGQDHGLHPTAKKTSSKARTTCCTLQLPASQIAGPLRATENCQKKLQPIQPNSTTGEQFSPFQPTAV